MLIFLNLYNMAHNDNTHRDLSVECANSFRHHMEKVHGKILIAAFFKDKHSVAIHVCI